MNMKRPFSAENGLQENKSGIKKFEYCLPIYMLRLQALSQKQGLGLGQCGGRGVHMGDSNSRYNL